MNFLPGKKINFALRIAGLFVLAGSVAVFSYFAARLAGVGLEFASSDSVSSQAADVRTALIFGRTSPEIDTSLYLGGRPPQFVVLSFDGSRSNDMWRETLDFSNALKKKNVSAKFTYFASSVYFLDEKNKNVYQAPRQARGASAIGFALSADEILERVKSINEAISSGHEIASHAAGHFSGTGWSEDEWASELKSSSDLFSRITLNNPELSGRSGTKILSAGVSGFRAPELGQDKNLYAALSKNGYIYDASKVSYQGLWPKKDEFGIWEFPLATLKIPEGWTIGMDYSIYQKQSGGVDTAKRGDLKWDIFKKEVLDSYEQYFRAQYYGNRAPVFIADHFSKWNDGVYWEAFKDFASEVCGMPEVRCVTYKELARYLEKFSPEEIAKFQSGDFEKAAELGKKQS